MTEHQRKIDIPTGTELRSHNWDGIQELDTPLPRWWLWTFLVTVIWAVGYWVFMPAWPLVSSYTRGTLGWSQRANVTSEMRATIEARRPLQDKLLAAPLESIESDAELFEFSQASGRALFKDNCAPCHGSGAQGALSYPNLNDDDWLWGGALSEIETTITHGVRNADEQSRFSEMPAFVKVGTLNRVQVADLVEYVLSLSASENNTQAAARGAALFVEHCQSCHGPDGKGDRTQGAPNLTDNIWLHGSSRVAITTTISNARNASMPVWKTRLTPAEIRALAVYVHSLGGGESEQQAAASVAQTPKK
jgi:cytochrome c oxidase cbb3-type subunit 3